MPIITFVNKLDREGCDLIDEIEQTLAPKRHGGWEAARHSDGSRKPYERRWFVIYIRAGETLPIRLGGNLAERTPAAWP